MQLELLSSSPIFVDFLVESIRTVCSAKNVKVVKMLPIAQSVSKFRNACHIFSTSERFLFKLSILDSYNNDWNSRPKSKIEFQNFTENSCNLLGGTIKNFFGEHGHDAALSLPWISHNFAELFSDLEFNPQLKKGVVSVELTRATNQIFRINFAILDRFDDLANLLSENRSESEQGDIEFL